MQQLFDKSLSISSNNEFEIFIKDLENIDKTHKQE